MSSASSLQQCNVNGFGSKSLQTGHPRVSQSRDNSGCVSSFRSEVTGHQGSGARVIPQIQRYYGVLPGVYIRPFTLNEYQMRVRFPIVCVAPQQPQRLQPIKIHVHDTYSFLPKTCCCDDSFYRTKVVTRSTMREIVHVQVGQCGNQIGAKFWEVRKPMVHRHVSSSGIGCCRVLPAF
jgi:hypothetical protein